MRIATKARFLLQMLAVSLAWATGPVMAQAQPAVALKAVPAKAQACTFVSASADGKEQICVKAGVKTSAKAPAPPKAKASLASGAAKNPRAGLALKPALALKTVPAAKETDNAANKVGQAAATPSGVPVAPVSPAPVAAAQSPPAAVAAAPIAQLVSPPSPAPVAVAPATAPSVALTATVAATSKATPGARKLRLDEAARRFTDGLELERKGDAQAAMLAYHDAAESGHGLAQKRLGDIYGTGTAFAERDYGQALKWYEKARAQGIEIPKPFTYSGLRQ